MATVAAGVGGVMAGRATKQPTPAKNPLLTNTRYTLLLRLKEQGLMDLDTHELPRTRIIPRCGGCGLIGGCSISCKSNG